MKLLLALALMAGLPAPDSSSSVWGVSYPAGPRGVLAPLDPVSLKPVGPRVRVPGYMWGWDRFGGQIALGLTNRGRVQIVDTRTRRSRVVEVRERTAVRHILWERPDRLVAIGGFADLRVWVLDPRSGRRLARRAVRGREVVAVRGDGTIVFLLAPTRGVGRASLGVVSADGSLRSIPLKGVRAGFFERVDLREGDPPDLVPGLAVDGRVAYVLAADRDVVVRVDLLSGAVSEGVVRTANGSMSERAGAAAAFPRPRARAAKGGAVRQRSLTVLSDGRLAAGGTNIAVNGFPRPWGIRVIDPRTWRARVIAPRATFVQNAGDVLLYTRYERLRRSRPTVFAYSPAGRRKWTASPRYGLSNVVVAGRYAYLQNGARRGPNHRTHVVDVETGRVVRTLRFNNLPLLLVDP